MAQFNSIVPVIMSGGSGTRLWPLSRQNRPKQFIPIAGPQSLFCQTLTRAAPKDGFQPPILVGNVSHRFLMQEEAKKAAGAGGSDFPINSIVLEPFGRNTAAAIAAAAVQASAGGAADPVMLILPSDHIIRDVPAFHRALDTILPAAEAGYLCCFGIDPTSPVTAYGYLERGVALDAMPGVHLIEAFREKPDAQTALEYVAGGRHSWNSGMFLFKASAVLEALNKYVPEVLEAVRAALETAEVDMDFLRISADTFARVPDISFDYAVMEKTDKAAFVSASMGWSDLGSFSALRDAGEKDTDGNCLEGDVLVQDTRNSFIHTDGPLVAVNGLDDMVVVVTDDVVMVTPAGKDQDVKKLVGDLKAKGREEVSQHQTVYRPWGSYRSIATGDRYQAKEIMVYPGKRLSLQKHHHRAEHWVIVQGTAIVTRNEETLMLSENQSVYLPLGAIHRLENPGTIPLRLIEIQSGSYLGEDDIVRFEDDFGRSGTNDPN